MPALCDLINLLVAIIDDPLRSKESVGAFTAAVWDTAPAELAPEVSDCLGTLAHDLDYYEPDASIRGEDPAYYGRSRLDDELRTAVARLKDLGVEVPNAGKLMN